jgi:hypothetical protein
VGFIKIHIYSANQRLKPTKNLFHIRRFRIEQAHAFQKTHVILNGTNMFRLKTTARFLAVALTLTPYHAARAHGHDVDATTAPVPPQKTAKALTRCKAWVSHPTEMEVTGNPKSKFVFSQQAQDVLAKSGSDKMFVDNGDGKKTAFTNIFSETATEATIHQELPDAKIVAILDPHTKIFIAIYETVSCKLLKSHKPGPQHTP